MKSRSTPPSTSTVNTPPQIAAALPSRHLGPLRNPILHHQGCSIKQLKRKKGTTIRLHYFNPPRFNNYIHCRA
eukprot:6473410-Amphidinium_carterae.1